MPGAISRLSREKDFKKINSRGKSFFSSLFRLRILDNKDHGNRFSVVVTTKVSKKATVRNRLKRQVKEIVRLNSAKLKQGTDFIIMVNSPALAKSYQDLEKDLLGLFAKSKLLL